MNIKSKKLLVVFAVVLIVTVIAPIRSNAGLQANKGGTSLERVSVSEFFKGSRFMETQYGTLGKNAVFDDKYVDTTGNGIDSHMILNTEWGTVAMLTASSFGAGKEITGNSDSTSTGNESGIYNLANGMTEYTATVNGRDMNGNRWLQKADARYYNKYEGGGTRFYGDATECINWLGATNSYKNNLETYPSLYRGIKSLFGYTITDAAGEPNMTSRAVVVCGENL